MFNRYFPDFNGYKFLITETCDFFFNGVNVIKTQTDSNLQRPAWGECLMMALKEINSDEVFLVLDDFILVSNVDNRKYNDAYSFFKENSCDFLTLAVHDFKRKSIKSNDLKQFVQVKQITPYRITTTPGFWKTQSLLSYLSPALNPWQFEILGSIKSYFRRDIFYMLNYMVFNRENEIFPYYFSNNLDTAIVRGKWQIDACEKFPEFSDKIMERGLMEPYVIHKSKTFSKVFSNPLFVIKYIIGLK
jgi:hypothetical protein